MISVVGGLYTEQRITLHVKLQAMISHWLVLFIEYSDTLRVLLQAIKTPP